MKRVAHGFTLIELMVGSAIGSIITLAAVAFVSHQTKLMGVTNEHVEMTQAGHFSFDLLRADLRIAGAGIGYNEAGSFAGLEVGSFARGGAQFSSNNRRLSSGSTDDLGLVLATGGQVTIAAFNAAGSAQFCSGSKIKAGESVILRSEDGLSARSIQVLSIAPGSCSQDACTTGCDNVTWGPDPAAIYSSGPSALDASYLGGTATGMLERVTWFVEDSDPDHPKLRRVVGDCAALDASCGEEVADRVESLQLRRYEWTSGAWVDVTNGGAAPTAGSRVRVDVELVVRGRVDHEDRIAGHEPMTLEPGACVPNCSAGDRFVRKTLRTSVEIKNSGRNQYWRGR
ncbi:MAG: prepilin-type N-terminal cleavage/methylation domain-containing protein [Myxococcota bacterium]